MVIGVIATGSVGGVCVGAVEGFFLGGIQRGYSTFQAAVKRSGV